MVQIEEDEEDEEEDWAEGGGTLWVNSVDLSNQLNSFFNTASSMAQMILPSY